MLGLQHEAAAAVEINAADGAMRQRRRLLENVGVGALVGRGGRGALNLQHVGQLAEEELIIGALGRARSGPARHKGSHVRRMSGWQFDGQVLVNLELHGRQAGMSTTRSRAKSAA